MCIMETVILSHPLDNGLKNKLHIALAGHPLFPLSLSSKRCGCFARAFLLARHISLSGLRQYRQQTESCRGWMLPAGQKSVSSKMFRPFTSVRSYGVTRIMTTVLVSGKFNDLGRLNTGVRNEGNNALTKARKHNDRYTDMLDSSPSRGISAPTLGS